MPICQELIFFSFIYDSYESIIFYLWQITETSSLSLSRLQSQDILVGPRPTIFRKGYFEGYFSGTKISVVNLNVVTSLSKVHFRLRPTMLFHVPCSAFHDFHDREVNQFFEWNKVTHENAAAKAAALTNKLF